MSWTHIRAAPGMGVQEQWIFRPDRAPICALKWSDEQWQLSLLQLDGLSCAVLWIGNTFTLEEAKVHGEYELALMGHKWESGVRVAVKKENKRWLKPSPRHN